MSGVIIDVKAQGADQTTRKISALERALLKVKRGADNAGPALDGISVKGLDKAKVILPQVASDFDKTGKSGEAAFSKINKGAVDTSSILANVQTIIARVAVSAAAIGSVTLFAKWDDELMSVNNRLKLVTSSQEKLIATQQRLKQISKATRSSLAESANIYATSLVAFEKLGVSEERTFNLVAGIQRSSAMSSGTIEGRAAAIRQLMQGIGAGVLQGEELGSVLEQADYIGFGLQEFFGKTGGELKKMAAEGQLSGESLVKALEAISEKSEGDFKSAMITNESGLKNFSNAVSNTVAEISKLLGVSGAIGKALNSAALYVYNVGDAIETSAYNTSKTLESILKTTKAYLGLGSIVSKISGMKIEPSALFTALSFNPFNKQLQSMVSRANSLVYGIVLTAARRIRNEVFTILREISKLFDNVVYFIIRKATIVFSFIKGNIAGLQIRFLIQRLIADIQSLFNATKRNWIKNIFNIEEINDVIQKTRILLAGIASYILGLVAGLFGINTADVVRSKLTEIFGAITSTISTLSEGLGGNLSSIIDKIEMLFVAIATIDVDDTIKALRQLGTAIVNTISTLINNVKDTLPDIDFSKLFSLTSTSVFEKLLRLLSNLKDKVLSVFGGVTGTVISKASGLLGALLAKAINVFEGVLSKIFSSESGDVIGKFIGEALTTIMKSLSSSKLTIKAVFDAKDILAAIQKIKTALAQLREFFKGFVAGFSDGFDFEIFSKLTSTLESVAKRGLGATFGIVKTFADNVIRAFFLIYDKVVGHSYWPDMIDDVNAYTPTLSSTFKYISNFVKGIADLFKGITFNFDLEKSFPNIAAFINKQKHNFRLLKAVLDIDTLDIQDKFITEITMLNLDAPLRAFIQKHVVLISKMKNFLFNSIEKQLGRNAAEEIAAEFPSIFPERLFNADRALRALINDFDIKPLKNEINKSVIALGHYGQFAKAQLLKQYYDIFGLESIESVVSDGTANNLFSGSFKKVFRSATKLQKDISKFKFESLFKKEIEVPVAVEVDKEKLIDLSKVNFSNFIISMIEATKAVALFAASLVKLPSSDEVLKHLARLADYFKRTTIIGKIKLPSLDSDPFLKSVESVFRKIVNIDIGAAANSIASKFSTLITAALFGMLGSGFGKAVFGLYIADVFINAFKLPVTDIVLATQGNVIAITKGVADSAVRGLQAALSVGFAASKGILLSLVNSLFDSFPPSIANGLRSAIDGIVSIFSTLPETLTNIMLFIIPTPAGMFGPLVSAVKTITAVLVNDLSRGLLVVGGLAYIAIKPFAKFVDWLLTFGKAATVASTGLLGLKVGILAGIGGLLAGIDGVSNLDAALLTVPFIFKAIFGEDTVSKWLSSFGVVISELASGFTKMFKNKFMFQNAGLVVGSIVPPSSVLKDKAKAFVDELGNVFSFVRENITKFGAGKIKFSDIFSGEILDIDGGIFKKGNNLKKKWEDLWSSLSDIKLSKNTSIGDVWNVLTESFSSATGKISSMFARLRADLMVAFKTLAASLSNIWASMIARITTLFNAFSASTAFRTIAILAAVAASFTVFSGSAQAATSEITGVTIGLGELISAILKVGAGIAVIALLTKAFITLNKAYKLGFATGGLEAGLSAVSAAIIAPFNSILNGKLLASVYAKIVAFTARLAITLQSMWQAFMATIISASSIIATLGKVITTVVGFLSKALIRGIGWAIATAFAAIGGWIIGGVALITGGLLSIHLFGDSDSFFDNLSAAYDKVRDFFGLKPVTDYGKLASVLREVKDISIDGKKIDLSKQISRVDFSKITDKEREVVVETGRNIKEDIDKLATEAIKSGGWTDASIAKANDLRDMFESMLRRMPQKGISTYMAEIDNLITRVGTLDSGVLLSTKNLFGDLPDSEDRKSWDTAQTNALWKYVSSSMQEKLALLGYDLVEAIEARAVAIKPIEGNDFGKHFSIGAGIEDDNRYSHSSFEAIDARISLLTSEYAILKDQALVEALKLKHVEDLKISTKQLLSDASSLANVSIKYEDWLGDLNDETKITKIHQRLNGINEALKTADIHDRIKLIVERKGLIELEDGLTELIQARGALNTAIEKFKIEGISDNQMRVIVGDKNTSKLLEDIKIAEKEFNSKFIGATDDVKQKLLSDVQAARVNALAIPIGDWQDDIAAALSQFNLGTIELKDFINLDKTKDIEVLKDELYQLREAAVALDGVIKDNGQPFENRIRAATVFAEKLEIAKRALQFINASAKLNMIVNMSLPKWLTSDGVNIPINATIDEYQILKDLQTAVSKAEKDLLVDIKDPAVFKEKKDALDLSKMKLERFQQGIKTAETKLSDGLQQLSSSGINVTKEVFASSDRNMQNFLQTFSSSIDTLSYNIEHATVEEMRSGKVEAMLEEKTRLINNFSSALIGMMNTSGQLATEVLGAFNIDTETLVKSNRLGTYKQLLAGENALRDLRSKMEKSTGNTRLKYAEAIIAKEREISNIRTRTNETLSDKLSNLNEVFGTNLNFKELFAIPDLAYSKIFEFAGRLKETLANVMSGGSIDDYTKTLIDKMNAISRYGSLIEFYRNLKNETEKALRKGVSSAFETAKSILPEHSFDAYLELPDLLRKKLDTALRTSDFLKQALDMPDKTKEQVEILEGLTKGISPEIVLSKFQESIGGDLKKMFAAPEMIAAETMKSAADKIYEASERFEVSTKQIEDSLFGSTTDRDSFVSGSVTAGGVDIVAQLTKNIEKFNSTGFDNNEILSHLLRLTKIESGFDPNAISAKGAVGLMQIMPDTGAKPTNHVQPLRDNSIEENLRFGTEYWLSFLKEFKDFKLADISYNGGKGVTYDYLAGKSIPKESAEFPFKIQNAVIDVKAIDIPLASQDKKYEIRNPEMSDVNNSAGAFKTVAAYDRDVKSTALSDMINAQIANINLVNLPSVLRESGLGSFSDEIVNLMNLEQIQEALDLGKQYIAAKDGLNTAIVNNDLASRDIIMKNMTNIKDAETRLVEGITHLTEATKEAAESFASTLKNDIQTTLSDILMSKSEGNIFENILNVFTTNVIDQFTKGLTEGIFQGLNMQKSGEELGAGLFKTGFSLFGNLFGGSGTTNDLLVGGFGGSATDAAVTEVFGGSLESSLGDITNSLDEFSLGLDTSFMNGVSGFGDILSKGISGIGDIFSGLGDSLGSIFSSIGTFFGFGFKDGGFIGAAFASGGIIKGPGTGTSDSIFAAVNGGGGIRVSKDEFIVNAKATKKHRSLIEAINRDMLPTFAEGGAIGDVTGTFSKPKINKESVRKAEHNKTEQTFHINVTGDVSSQTRRTILTMVPELATGVNRYNKEKNVK